MDFFGAWWGQEVGILSWGLVPRGRKQKLPVLQAGTGTGTMPLAAAFSCMERVTVQPRFKRKINLLHFYCDEQLVCASRKKLVAVIFRDYLPQLL